MEALLQEFDTLLLYVFAALSLAGAIAMLVLQHPMRVAMALVATMIWLGAIYGLVGVHFIAAFQILIYVSAVMVFIIYVIMLLDVRDPSFVRKYSHLLVPGLAFGGLLALALAYAVSRTQGPAAQDVLGMQPGTAFLIQPFSAEFLRDYWLHFELTSVLLLAAVVAAVAVIKGGRRNDG